MKCESYSRFGKKFSVESASKINVFIIGLRGYTQNYGGWEAFAHGLLDNWKDESIHFYAFEKVSSIVEEGFFDINGVTCIRVCETEKGSSAMMKYDKKCTNFAYLLKKDFNIENAIMFHLGVRIGPYLWLKRKKIKKIGFKMMENPAGAEWRRTKWNKLVQLYLWISAIMMAKSTDCMACDNEGIKDLYGKIIHGKKPKLEYVAYGVDSVPPVNDQVPAKVSAYFEKLGIVKNDYYLILGRFVPENNYELMFKGFGKSKTTKKLVVVCNYQTEIRKFYNHIKKTTNFEDDERIIMAGTVYDKEILHYLRQYAAGYIHGHSVGGTNPGLLEAMAETNVNMLFDVEFNKHVGGETALYFKSIDELASSIDKVDALSQIEKDEFGKKAKERMAEKYSWKLIVDEYDRIFNDVAKGV